MSLSPESTIADKLELLTSVRTAELLRSNEALRHEVALLKMANSELQVRLDAAAIGGQIDRETRRAALNLMEDAISARAAEQRENEKRQQVEAELREADRRKDEFLATLAHELRNPLAPIRNSLHILRLAGSDADVADRLHDMIERQVNHMVRLVDDLMEVSRISRGKVDLRLEKVDLAAIVRSAIETSQPHIQAGHHALTIDLPATAVILYGDAVRLAQVLSNLLNNAAKYTEERGTIHLSACLEGQQVAISVRDNGIGIEPEKLSYVFELFTQIDRGLEKAQGGLGIGLSLVQSLVDMHGGSVQALSDGPGQGSEFVVRLPIISEQMAPTTRAAHCNAAGLMVQHRILVVDDNWDAANSLGMLLKCMGADVEVADNGETCLQMVQTYRPTYILLDIGMPGMDGYEVARRTRQLPEGSNIVLIALTGWGQAEDRRRTKEAGFDHHLVKPVDLDLLQSLFTTELHPQFEAR